MCLIFYISLAGIFIFAVYVLFDTSKASSCRIRPLFGLYCTSLTVFFNFYSTSIIGMELLPLSSSAWCGPQIALRSTPRAHPPSDIIFCLPHISVSRIYRHHILPPAYIHLYLSPARHHDPLYLRLIYLSRLLSIHPSVRPSIHPAIQFISAPRRTS